MTRAALLPSGPDPYLLAYWLRNYATWADAVDVLEIVVCGQNDPELRAYIAECVAEAPHASVRFIDNLTDHGVVIDLLVTGCSADLVVLCENDAYVQKPAVIAECFERIESGEADLVGTPRQYSSNELSTHASRLWGDTPRADNGESGWAFSPAFLFVRLVDLDRVEPEGYPRFSGTRWPQGTRIASLQTIVSGDQLVGDTFVGASLQLRAMGLRCEIRTAYRSEQATSYGPWFHVGSLSAGYGIAFLGTDRLRQDAVGNAKDDPRDWFKRCAWWTHIWRNTGGPEGHRIRYIEALASFIDEAGLGRVEINQQVRELARLVTWIDKAVAA